jgi:alkanesulfonate monooxygenase SsuD/methylene tetrahydromethanopterin reductase-like flavin-dependent oxidoreductase (luciferase family)
MSVKIGIFVVPDATREGSTVEQVKAAEQAGLDLVGVQDHPYQRRFFDTWTLLSYLAGQTSRVRLLTDVVNLPLRLPSVLAKSAASLDRLSGGRVELGIGAGTFWDAVAAMGGPKRTPKESVDALEEAIAIVKAFWSGERSLDFAGQHYRVEGAKPGPPAAHRIGLWIGAYGPRMLRLTGRLGDAWLPSVGGHYLTPEQVPEMQTAIDTAAEKAGRDPAEIERAVNIMELEGGSKGWSEQLADVVTGLHFTTLLVSVPQEDPVSFIYELGEEVAPELRTEFASDSGAVAV